MNNAEIVYRETAMLDPDSEFTAKDCELLRAAHYRIGVCLGIHPKPATAQDLAANAYAARFKEAAE